MREVTLYWARSRLRTMDTYEILDAVEELTFLTAIARTDRAVEMLIRVVLVEGVELERIERHAFLKVLEIIPTPDEGSSSYILRVESNHPLILMHANVGNIWTVEGSGLDKEGMNWTIRGANLRLRIAIGTIRRTLNPDRISARPMAVGTQDGHGMLSRRQLRIAKFAYDRGWYDAKSGVTITDLSSELGMARATLSEHLNKISNIVMQTLLGTYDDARIDASQANRIAEELERVLVGLDEDEEEAFEAFLKEFRGGDPSTNP